MILAGALLAAFVVGRLSSIELVRVHEHADGDRPHVHLGTEAHAHGEPHEGPPGGARRGSGTPHSHEHDDGHPHEHGEGDVHGAPNVDEHAGDAAEPDPGHDGADRQSRVVPAPLTGDPMPDRVRAPGGSVDLHWHAETPFPRAAIASTPDLPPAHLVADAVVDRVPRGGHARLAIARSRAPPG